MRAQHHEGGEIWNGRSTLHAGKSAKPLRKITKAFGQNSVARDALHEITGSPEASAACARALMCPICVLRSGLWLPSMTFALACRLWPCDFNNCPTTKGLVACRRPNLAALACRLWRCFSTCLWPRQLVPHQRGLSPAGRSQQRRAAGVPSGRSCKRLQRCAISGSTCTNASQIAQ